MWYLIIAGLSLLLFFMSPWEPLLQASNLERVQYSEIAGKFSIFDPVRVLLALAAMLLSFLCLFLSKGPAFLIAFFVPAAVLYGLDFRTAMQIAKRHASNAE